MTSRRSLVVAAALLAGAEARAQGAVTLVAAGDVVVHRRVAESAARHASDGGYAWVLAPLRSELAPEAVAFANLETPLSERYRRPGNATPPVLGADPSLAGALAAAGFDAVSVANNHSLDQTAAGLAETMDALAASHVVFAGAGRSPAEADRAAVIERGGLRVALVAFTDRVNAGPGPDPGGVALALSPDGARVARALRAARRGGDVVALSIHWSRDFAYAPTAAQRHLARAWVDAGADVIVGTGPHVLQRVERVTSPRGEAVVAWSLGNLVSNQGSLHAPGGASRADPERCPFARDGALLRVTVAREGDRIRVRALEAVPLWTENDRAGVVRSSPLRDAPASVRAERRPAIAAALGPAVTLVD